MKTCTRCKVLLDENAFNKLQSRCRQCATESRRIIRATVGQKPRIKNIVQRFLLKLDQTSADGCWPWKECRTQEGYGKFSYPKPNGTRAHRFAYVTFVGPIPSGMMVCHKCDNPPCCNPDHLFLGTHQENMADKMQKERQARGSGIGVAKLIESQVLEIRDRLAAGERQVNVAARFGITQANVSIIKLKRGWRHMA
jgi:hypothetical protein